MEKTGNGSTRLVYKGHEYVSNDHLFPDTPVTNWDYMPPPKVRNIFKTSELVFTRVISEFTVAELMKDAKKMSFGNAGSPLSFPNEIMKRIILACPREILKVYNECLNSLTFPTTWKKIKLVLLY